MSIFKLNDKYDIPLKELIAQERRERRILASLCVVAGVLGALWMVLYFGNNGYETPLYTWLATVAN
jgi:hypothetical protein